MKIIKAISAGDSPYKIAAELRTDAAKVMQIAFSLKANKAA